MLERLDKEITRVAKSKIFDMWDEISHLPWLTHPTFFQSRCYACSNQGTRCIKV